MDVATKLKHWTARKPRFAGGDDMPAIQSVEDLKDWLHEHLLMNSRYLPETDCSVFTHGERLEIMSVKVTVARLAAWIWGCVEVPPGWDLFDRQIRIKARCGNRACINFDHLTRRGTGKCSRRALPITLPFPATRGGAA